MKTFRCYLTADAFFSTGQAKKISRKTIITSFIRSIVSLVYSLAIDLDCRAFRLYMLIKSAVLLHHCCSRKTFQSIRYCGWYMEITGHVHHILHRWCHSPVMDTLFIIHVWHLRCHIVSSPYGGFFLSGQFRAQVVVFSSFSCPARCSKVHEIMCG